MTNREERRKRLFGIRRCSLCKGEFLPERGNQVYCFTTMPQSVACSTDKGIAEGGCSSGLAYFAADDFAALAQLALSDLIGVYLAELVLTHGPALGIHATG
jgi:hypothetical protein